MGMTQDPPNNEWVRQGASGPVPLLKTKPSGFTYRTAERPSRPEMARWLLYADRQWRKGHDVGRLMATIRSWGCLGAFDGKVFTDLSWMSDFFDPESPLYEPFRETCATTNLMPGTNEELNAALAFAVMQTLQDSDTPSFFRLSEGLTWKLLSTELKGVYPDDIRLPMQGFYVEVPKGVMYLLNNLTGWHPLQSLCIVEGNPVKNPRVSVNVDLEYGYGRRLLILAHCAANENSSDPGDDNVMYFSLPLFDSERSIEDMMKQDFQVVQERGGDWRDEKVGGTFMGHKKTNLELRNLLRQFVINVLLYMNSPNADIQHVHQDRIRALQRQKKGRKKNAKQIQKLKSEKVWLVGTKVQFDPRIRQLAEGGKKGGGQKLRYKSLVRGHWRRQAYGPKWSLRKLRWIEPHVRGGDLPGQVLGHEYEVK